MNKILIDKEPIELYKLLKLAGVASTGGEAKTLIAEGHILVNKKLETQKRKKINSGDIVEFDGQRLSVKLSGDKK